jgi:hypothetical protein
VCRPFINAFKKEEEKRKEERTYGGEPSTRERRATGHTGVRRLSHPFFFNLWEAAVSYSVAGLSQFYL